MQTESMVKFCLTYQDEIKAAINAKRLDPGTQKQGGAGHCHISDPTAVRAMRNCAEVQCVLVYYGPFLNGRQESRTVRWPERWLRVVDCVERHYAGQVQADIIDLRFRKGLDHNDIWKNVRVGRTTYFQLYNGIFLYAEGAVEALGADK